MPTEKIDLAHAIRIRGAREHNLRNIDVDIPRDKLVVVTGLSGSGKSTLAFDTVYAEGQRRYVESLSAYARQFLEQLQKPDVESIEGLTPTIAIEQRSGHGNPRSTVATVTEIYDYLRVLYARVGTPHCPKCGRAITGQTAEQIVEHLLALPEGSRVEVLAPLVRGKKGEHRDIFAAAKREGFVRLRVDGQTIGAADAKPLDKKRKHSIEAVVDRLRVKPDARTRFTESVELALKVGEGLLIASVQETESGKPADQLFSEHFACPVHGLGLEELSPRIFSFNSPYGACSACAGLGTKNEVDAELLIPDRTLSIQDGVIKNLYKLGYNYGIWYGQAVRRFCHRAKISVETPVEKLAKPFLKTLLNGSASPGGKVYGGKPFRGLIPSLTERFHATQSEHIKQRIHEFMSNLSCPECKGARLRPEVLGVHVGGKNIMQVTALPIDQALAFFADLPLEGEKKKIAHGVLKEIRERLGFLVDVGLGYLTLDRTSGTLSGGEAQRIRLASQVGSKLVGVTYVLDEPTIGLHQRDNDRLLNTLVKLRDLGNTVLVVEHDEDVIRRSDWLVDLGPGAGEKGGQVVASGHAEDLSAFPDSLTGKYLRRELEIPLPRSRRPFSSEVISVKGGAENNLKKVNVDFPLGRFVCVTGVSGSGKSSLVNEILYKSLARKLNNARAKPGKCEKVTIKGDVDKVIEVDQSPIGRTPRSNPATYTGVFDEIRTLFVKLPEAKIRGYKPGRFSFNVKGGRCEACEGQGQKAIEMHFLADVYVECEQCKGRRFNKETLEVKYKGHSIADVLDLSIDAAVKLFENHPKIRDGLQTLKDVGLGYVRLGQSSTTLSGGEAQRIKLAFELSKRATGRTVYVLDEPTTGLHFHDIAKLLDVLQRLVERGNTAVVIEHNLDVIKQADWIVDLGPEGGDAGGTVVAQGTPETIAACKESFTGHYLKTVLRAQEVAAAKTGRKRAS
ncbi:MAG: excinuclease ABC subunit UvrA [Planctomycetes bacterium]|nr:excinuclease ABC subunit UvrA [Planctomycetota bacterium]